MRTPTIVIIFFISLNLMAVSPVKNTKRKRTAELVHDKREGIDNSQEKSKTTKLEIKEADSDALDIPSVEEIEFTEED